MLGNLINTTKGQEREDMLPMFGRGIIVGAAVVGEYTGHGEYTTTDKDEQGNVTGEPRTVRYIKLRNVVEFRPDAPGSEQGKSVQHIALGVPLNADTRQKLDPDTLTLGMVLLIQFTGTDPKFNNMRRFRVELITSVAYRAIMHASSEGGA